jgi:hypothetical protein
MVQKTIPSGNAYVLDYSDNSFNVLNGTGNVRGDRLHPNPIEFTRNMTANYTGSWTRTIASTGSLLVGYYGNLGQSPPFPLGWDRYAFSAVAYNRAYSDLFEQVRGKLDVSIDAFQAGQTLQLVKRVNSVVQYVRKIVRSKGVSGLQYAYRDFQRTRKRNGWQGDVKTPGSLWLEFIYGLKPLLQDAYDAFDQILKSAKERYIHIRSRGSDTDYQKQEWSFGFGGYSSTVHTVSKRTRRCEFGVILHIPESRLLELAGYTSLNPVSIAWELTPFSFVVDWVVDVGGYIRNLENLALYHNTFHSGYVTESVRIVADGSLDVDEVSGNERVISDARGGSTSWTYKRRSALLSLPTPRVPPVNVSLGTGRLLNAAALISQLLRVGPR